jgi:hypothetical protein
MSPGFKFYISLIKITIKAGDDKQNINIRTFLDFTENERFRQIPGQINKECSSVNSISDSWRFGKQ